MKRSIVFVLFAFLVGVSSLVAAPRLTSVEPTMASPGDALVALGTDLNEVELLFLTVGATDVKVEITGKTAGEIKFKLPADVPHGNYRLMLQTGGEAPALLVQPIGCEVMSAAEIAARKAEMEKEQERIEDAAAPAPQQ
jgi:hypothetical protein